jgi:nucleoside-diphosphate-sugar epimerase
VNESAPLCTAAPSAYPTSKAAAERLVTAAHSPELATVSLRPHLVWGPGDKNVVPRVLALARQGRLRIIGAGTNRVDCTHITNVVDAHLLAERKLCRATARTNTGLAAASNGAGESPISDFESQMPAAGGRAYFITNGEPVRLWEWINQLLRGVDLPEIKNHVSLRMAYAAGSVLETLWRTLPLKGEPPMTRFVAKEMATDHWFDITAARRDLGYQPRVSMTEGTAELVASYRQANL